MNLEEMRRELMLHIHDLVGEDALLMRDAVDYQMSFPLVIVDFLGPLRRQYSWLSAYHDGKESWVMAERVNITIATMQKDSGSDTSRLELQALLDKIEFGARKKWPTLVRKFGCGIFYPESWLTSFRSQFYNEKRLNIAVLKITLLEPRTSELDFEGQGPPLKRVTADFKEEGGTFENIDIQIED